jgi:hypothetical protein
MGTNFRESIPIGIKSYPALALLSPGSVYDGMLTEPRHLQALDWEIGLYKATYGYLNLPLFIQEIRDSR